MKLSAKRHLGAILFICLLVNIIAPSGFDAGPVGMLSAQPVYAISESDPNYFKYGGNGGWVLSSAIWNGPSTGSELWTWYVDGANMGQMWCFVSKGKGYNTLSPGSLSSWVSAFGGNLAFVQARVSSASVKVDGPKDVGSIFYRYYARDIVTESGATVSKWDPQLKTAWVTTTKAPFGNISKPYSLQAGESGSFAITGTAYAGNSMSYTFKIDGATVDSGSVGTSLNKTVSRTLSEGTHSLELVLTDAFGRTSSQKDGITVSSGSGTTTPIIDGNGNTRPSASFSAPAAAKTGEAISVTEDSTDPDGSITSRIWSVSPTAGVVNNLTPTGGTLKFNNEGSYEIRLIVTDNDGATDTRVHTISVSTAPPPPPENKPPVAKIYMPDEIREGDEFTLFSGSYDPDGFITRLDWNLPGSGLVGAVVGQAQNVYFNAEGTYTIGLMVEDNAMGQDYASKTVEVKPAVPVAVFAVRGTQKVNRKITLDGTYSNTPSRYPLDISKTEWVITPLTAGVTAADIKIDMASPLNKRDVLFKKPGTYSVKLRVWNNKHPSAWVEKQIIVGNDEPPVANFFVQSATTRDPNNGNRILIPLTDTSYTTDGDIIGQRIWKYRFDSDNDGSFTDEGWVSISAGNEPKPTVEVWKVGKYQFELEVVESFSESTISGFVSSTDILRANTDSLPVSKKTVEVTNVNPMVSFEASAKQKVDVLFTVGKTDPSKALDLAGKISTYITSKLAANNIDVRHVIEQTPGAETKSSFVWRSYCYVDDYYNNQYHRYRYDEFRDLYRYQPAYYFEPTGAAIGDQTVLAGFDAGRAALIGGSNSDDKMEDASNWMFTKTPDDLSRQKTTFKYRGNPSYFYDGFGVMLNGSAVITSPYYTHDGSQNGNNMSLSGYVLYFTGIGNVRWEDWYSYWRPGTINITVYRFENQFHNTSRWAGAFTFTNGLEVIADRFGDYANRYNRLNPNMHYVGQISGLNATGEIEVEATKTSMTIKEKTSGKQSSFSLPTHYGWDSGIMADERSTELDYLQKPGGYFYVSDFLQENSQGKTLEEVLSAHTWRDNASRYVVNLSDGLIPDLSDPKSAAAVLASVSGASADFDVLGTSANQSQAQTFISQNSGNGVFYNNSNMNTAMNNLGNYILNKTALAKKTNVRYVVLGEELDYQTQYGDYESDPQYASRWYYQHDPGVFQNSLGLASFHNTYRSSPVTLFDKVGKYLAEFQVRDNPVGTDNRFDVYRKWSGMAEGGVSIYVHRRPVAQLSIGAVDIGNNQFRISASESSYDPDHQSDTDRGLVAREWKWRNVSSTTWTSGSPNGAVVAAGHDYVVQLRVRDKDGFGGVGEWSHPVTQFITTKTATNIAPVAMFEASPNPLPAGATLSITDRSFDANGDAISQRNWVVKNAAGTEIFNGASAPTGANFAAWGIGNYTVILKVMDSKSSWSAPYSQPLVVVASNRKPVASFSISHTSIPTDAEVSYTDTSSDPDGNTIGLREWRWKYTTSSTWTNGTTPPKAFAGWATGTLQVQLRVRDTPPGQTALYSDWVEQRLVLTAPNAAPTAAFTVSPNPVPTNKTVTYTDTSSDPEGKGITSRKWTVTCAQTGQTATYYDQLPPVNFAGWGTAGNGVGTYTISLQVKDAAPNGFSPERWSSTVSRTLTVVAANRRPVAQFTVSPNPVPLDVGVSYSDTSYDPDGNVLDLREWRWKYTTASVWTTGTTPPSSFAGWQAGILQIQLRVRDKQTVASQDVLYSDWVEQRLTLIPANEKPVARFTISPNPVPADEPVAYMDTSYDPEGKALSSRIWVVTCQETGQTQQYTNTTPPTIFETTGWGVEQDGVGTYTITLKVKDTSPNGLSPELWSDVYSQVLVVETPLRITGLKMTSHVNAPAGTVLPIDYPVAAPTSIKAGYKMTFSLFTNGGDTAVIKVFANGVRVPVQMDDGMKSEITVPTTRKNSVSAFTFWLDKDLPAGTVLDMKIELSKTKYDGTVKTLIDTILGERFGVVIGSSKQDSEVNLIK